MRGSRSFKEFRVHHNRACVASLVWSRGSIPESPGPETRPDRRLPGTCPGAGRQGRGPGPGPSLAETWTHMGVAAELGGGPPRHPSPTLPGIRQQEKENTSARALPSPCGDAHGARAGVGRRGSTCCLLGLEFLCLRTQPLLTCWGTIRGP